ncbi:MAG TPA: hypothetical protein VFQ82_09145 [Stellaceae bacterium]|nr:hypothetical protein [Stellaceae bacterium]
MPAETSGPDSDGFAFTDEDFARRYATGDGSRQFAGSRDLPPAPSIPTKTGPRPIHGGGNSFMRARRRRAATRGI